MSCNAKLEAMINGSAGRWKGLEKKKMFGGVCYLLKGNMAFGTVRAERTKTLREYSV